MPQQSIQVYSFVARFFHWLTVLLLILLFASGIAMTERTEEYNLWDATTNTLYSSHKALGLMLLAVIILRLGYRMAFGTPPAPPSLNGLQKMAADGVHWGLYGLLVAVPITGWIGISMFPALDVFGVRVPALVAADRQSAEWAFEVHEILGNLFLILIAVHIAAALFHYFILKDGILQRMWFTKNVAGKTE